MSRNFVALTGLAVAGALLLPDTSWGLGGMRGGGGGMRAGGFLRAAPVIVNRNPRAGILHRGAPGMARPHFRSTVTGSPFHAARHLRLPRQATGAFSTSNVYRLSHRGYISGWLFPITTWGDSSYIGTPYDPAETIPVYAPYPPEDLGAPAARPLLPRLTNAGEENANQDACRSEKVTVPASEGEREITVVRC